jgi:hypothetical protein
MKDYLKLFFVICYLATSSLHAYTDSKVGGTITLSPESLAKGHDKGLILIELIEKNSEKIVARNEIQDPHFPQAFVLTAKHLVAPFVQLDGEFQIKIKYFSEKRISEKATLMGRLVSGTMAHSGQRDLVIELFKTP